jgi:hypothetical protein
VWKTTASSSSPPVAATSTDKKLPFLMINAPDGMGLDKAGSVAGKVSPILLVAMRAPEGPLCVAGQNLIQRGLAGRSLLTISQLSLVSGLLCMLHAG